MTSEIDKILEHDSFRIKGWAMPGEGREIEQGGKTHRPVEEWPVSSHANAKELPKHHKAVTNVGQPRKRYCQPESTSEGSVRLSC